jgi:prepilin-type N-terminal cleavage/methylation domain-containing protein
MAKFSSLKTIINSMRFSLPPGNHYWHNDCIISWAGEVRNMHQINLNVIKDNKAMTMIESMIVLSIIAIMLGIGAPSFFNYQHTLKLRTAARELTSDIRYTRQLAVSTNTTHRLCFDGTNTNLYTIYRNNACSGTVVRSVDIAKIYSGVTKTQGTTQLVFSTLGCISATGTACVPGDVDFELTESDVTQFSKTKTITVGGNGNVAIH